MTLTVYDSSLLTTLIIYDCPTTQMSRWFHALWLPYDSNIQMTPNNLTALRLKSLDNSRNLTAQRLKTPQGSDNPQLFNNSNLKNYINLLDHWRCKSSEISKNKTKNSHKAFLSNATFKNYTLYKFENANYKTTQKLSYKLKAYLQRRTKFYTSAPVTCKALHHWNGSTWW